MKSERKKKVSSLKENIKGQRRKYMELKRDIETPSQEDCIEKGNTKKILKKKEHIKKEISGKF